MQWGGSAVVDDCGVCAGGATGLSANANKDCAGVCLGAAQVDRCGVCAEGSTEFAANADEDCNGECFGLALIDSCGTCSGGGTGLVVDGAVACDGECGGESRVDECGTCDRDPSNDCVQDCVGIWGGSAITDNCGTCVGGTTGAEACTQDCAGVWGGAAVSRPHFLGLHLRHLLHRARHPAFPLWCHGFRCGQAPSPRHGSNGHGRRNRARVARRRRGPRDHLRAGDGGRAALSGARRRLGGDLAFPKRWSSSSTSTPLSPTRSPRIRR